MSLALIKSKAVALSKTPAFQAAKATAESMGNSYLDRMYSEQEDKYTSKLKELDKKLDKFGVSLFDPKEVMQTVTDTIKNEHGERNALRKKLDGFRLDLEKDMEKKDFSVMSKYTSSLCSKAQDAFTTAVTDGVIKDMLPDSIKNPFGGGEEDSEDGTSESGTEETEKKKGFLETAKDLFNSAKDIALDAAMSTVSKETGGTVSEGRPITSEGGPKESDNKSVLSKLLSSTGIVPSEATSGENKAMAALVNAATNAATSGLSAAMSLVKDDSEASNNASFFDKIKTVASTMSTGISKSLSDNNATATGDTKSTPQLGLADYFKNPMAILQNDITGNLIEKTTENVISRIATDSVNLFKEPSFDNLVGTMTSAFHDSISGITSASKELYAGVTQQAADDTSTPSVKQTAVGPFTLESITNAIVENTFKSATEKGDTNALVKGVVEEKIIWCSGKKGCSGCAKSCTQTPENIKNVLVAADTLGVDLNTVTNCSIKTPDQTSNIGINENKPVGEVPPDPVLEITDTIDLVEFRELIKNGTSLAKIILGIDEFNKCMGLLKAQDAFEASLTPISLNDTMMVA